MNAAVVTALTTDLKNLAAWNGDATVTWQGNPYVAITARLSEGSSLQPGGEFNDYAGRVVLSLRDFQTESPPGTWTTGAIPKAGQWVTIGKRELRIERVITDDGHPTLTLHLSHGDNQLKDL